MSSSSQDQMFIFDQTKQLQQFLAQYTQCSWDDRHQALLAEFSVDHQVAIMQALELAFPSKWNHKTIKSADPLLKHKAGKFAKMTQSQYLLTEDNHGGDSLMASWWPWGHGATVSVRICRINQAPYVEKQGLFSKIRSFLGSD